MTIRTRLTLWYAVVSLASLLAMGTAAYFEIARSRGEDLRKAGVTTELIATDQQEDFGEIAEILLWYGLPAALLALAGGWWLMKKSFAPVTDLTHAAEKITERSLRERLPRSGNGDELDRLTEVFNTMTARLDDSFNRIREFTLHASHELKTPLTVLHNELEIELHNEALPAEQREKLAGQLDEIQRLSKIVDGLTLLTKADAGQVALSFESVALDEIVRDAFEDAQTLAKPQSIQVELADCQKVNVHGDRHRLRQLLLNLADNAVKYNQPQGQITMSLKRVGNLAHFAMANTGAGIPPDKLSRVFDRFFRGDESHNLAVDGCGLGLSIAKWIVSAHGGTIRMESVLSQRTAVTVELPVSA